MTHFSYNQFHEYYTDFNNDALYESSDELNALIYDCKAFYGEKHNRKARELRKFRYNLIEKAPRLRVLSAEYHRHFHHGVFFLLNERQWRQSKELSEQVMFVYPRKKDIMDTRIESQHFYGDHLSFQYVKDTELPVNIHETVYIPTLPDETVGGDGSYLR